MRRASKSTSIALAIHTLGGGGLERVVINLATEMAARGYRVDLLVARAEGNMRELVPDSVRMPTLRASRRLAAHARMVAADPGGLGRVFPLLLDRKSHWMFKYIPSLTQYLGKCRPDALLAAHTPVNLAALWARRLAGAGTRLVVSEHVTLSEQLKRTRTWYKHAYPALMRRTYGWAEAIVAVSAGVADDLAARTGLPRAHIATIHNPVDPRVAPDAQTPLDHPWFAAGSPPVVLSAGRLVDQKDFATLLRAFARVRRSRVARLMILGEGKQRAGLEALARELDIAADMDLPGWQTNPHAFMARAGVFVMSSTWEGFGSVLVEALASGCPVVSTDCPSGPAEILAGGKFGALVPVGDAPALAQAILTTLDTPPDRARLQARAADFSIDMVTDQYLELLLGESPWGMVKGNERHVG